MKRLRLSVALAILILTIPLQAIASAEDETFSPSLVFTEVKIRNDTAGLNEFIEIYNPTDSDIFLNDFTLEYSNTTNPAPDQEPVRAVIAEGLLPPDTTYVLAKDAQQIPNATASPFSSLSDSGGMLRITDTAGVVHDEIIWTSSASLAVSPIVQVPTSSSSKSLQRTSDSEGKPIINPATWILVSPQPISSVLLPPPVIEEPEPEPEIVTEEEIVDPVTETPQDDEEIEPEPVPVVVLEPLQITELLPNPKAPEIDNDDEFVELYNPNPEPIDLSGYKIQTGTSYSYTYVFDGGTIAPNGYVVVLSGQSNLSLANTAGKARLLAPNGAILAETGAYQDAEEGSAWALIAGSWQWTTTPTSSAPNILTLPVVEAKPAKANKTLTAKATKVKAASTPKVKATSTKKTGTPKTTKNDDKSQVAAAAAIDTPPPMHPGVLAGVSALAVIYAAYEYRADMANRLYQFRSYRAARRAARSESSGR